MLVVFVILFLLTSAMWGQSATPKLSYDPQKVEQTVWGGGDSCDGKSTQTDIDPGHVVFDRLVKPIKSQIYKAWIPLISHEGEPPHSVKALTTVEFRILASGKVEYARIVRSSGNIAFNDAALGAISNARLEPFPNEMRIHWLTFKIDFLVNAKCKDFEAKATP